MNDQVTHRVGQILHDLTGLQIDESNNHSSFMEMGFDSLFLIQFSTSLKNKLGIDVSFRQMLSQYSSFAALIEHITNQIDPAALATENQQSRTLSNSTPNFSQQVNGQLAQQIQGDSARYNANSTEYLTQPNDDHEVLSTIQSNGLHTISNTDQTNGSNNRPDISPIFSHNADQSLMNNPVSAHSTEDDVSEIIVKQLDIMALQLAALQEPAVTLMSRPSDHSASAPATPTDSTHISVSPTVLKSANASTEKPKPFGAIARIDTTRHGELTEEQEDWLIRFTHRYNEKTKLSKNFTQKHRKVHADPRVVSGFRPALKELIYPIVAKRTEGCRIWDLDGIEYIDALNGFGSNFFGYANPQITQAVVDQLWNGAEIGPQNRFTGEAAQLICELTGMERVGFCNTGSEAVMGAMRIARTVTGRDLIVIFDGSYHGIFDEVLVRGTPQLRSIPAAPGITRTSVQNTLVLEYGTQASLEIIRSRIGELAAVMVEPVQSRRPDFQPREFLQQIRKITSDNDVPLIVDEVITGFRTSPGGAQAHFGIQADLATYGKVIGGGMPIGVVAGTRKYMDTLDGGFWEFGNASEPEAAVTYFAGTFVRHPASIAACLASLKIMQAEGPSLQTSVNAKTEKLADELNTFFTDEGLPAQISYFGSLWRIEIQASEEYGELLFCLMREKGVHIYDIFPCFLTIQHRDRDVDYIVNAVKEAALELSSVGFMTTAAKKKRLRMN